MGAIGQSSRGREEGRQRAGAFASMDKELPQDRGRQMWPVEEWHFIKVQEKPSVRMKCLNLVGRVN